MDQLNFDIISKLLKYDQQTGKIYWLARTPDMFIGESQTPEHACNRWNSKFAGKEAGFSKHNGGYNRISIFNKRYLTHRIIWILQKGDWPLDKLDHKNGIRTENKIENLREANTGQNNQNKKIQRNNSSGVKGIYFRKDMNIWRVDIQVNKERIFVGNYETKEEAAEARRLAELKYHKDFAYYAR